MIAYHSKHFRKIGAFLNDSEAVSAIEFALMVPIMLTLLLGSVELGNGFATSIRVSKVAHTVADIASQFTSIQSSDMTNILAAGTAIVAPYPSAPLAVTVSELNVTTGGGAVVVWSGSTISPRSAGQQLTLPSALSSIPAGTRLIFGEASYIYKPTLGYALTGSYPMADNFYQYLRLTKCVTYNNAC